MLRWLIESFSIRGRALLRYRRGMQRAKKRFHREAIGEYTAVIEMAGAPADVVAMARYNRALVYSAVGDQQAAINDLETVLDNERPLVKIKTAARHLLQRVRKHLSRRESGKAPAS